MEESTASSLERLMHTVQAGAQKFQEQSQRLIQEIATVQDTGKTSSSFDGLTATLKQQIQLSQQMLQEIANIKDICKTKCNNIAQQERESLKAVLDQAMTRVLQTWAAMREVTTIITLSTEGNRGSKDEEHHQQSISVASDGLSEVEYPQQQTH